MHCNVGRCSTLNKYLWTMRNKEVSIFSFRATKVSDLLLVFNHWKRSICVNIYFLWCLIHSAARILKMQLQTDLLLCQKQVIKSGWSWEAINQPIRQSPIGHEAMRGELIDKQGTRDEINNGHINDKHKTDQSIARSKE